MTDAPAIKQNASGVWFLEGEQLWDSDILPVCLEHIKEGDTVIDAGAWIGGHTMAYAKKVGKTGKIHAFEPNPVAYKCLVLNTVPFENVGCFQMALGDKREIVPFSAKKGWQDSGHVGYPSKDYIPDAELVDTVPMESLDLANPTPNFIKIDVEGCELKVLKGAAKTIEKHRPKMVIEINKPALERQGTTPHEVLGWLYERMYSSDIIEDSIGDDVFNILATPK